MRQFDEVDELSLRISVPQGIIGYKSFLNETNKLSKCETSRISLAWNQHGLAPAIAHIFRCCKSVRKLSAELRRKHSCGPSLMYSCPSSCPCRLPESCKIDDIALCSLEEVEIISIIGSHEEMEFVELLSRRNASFLKNLVINYTRDHAPPLTKEACEKVRSVCSPNLKVKFYVISDEKRVHFD